MTHSWVLRSPGLLAELCLYLPAKEIYVVSATSKSQQYSPVLMRFQLSHLRQYSRRQATIIRRAANEVVSALEFVQEKTAMIFSLHVQLQATWEWARHHLRHRVLMRVAEIMFPPGSQWRPEGTIEV